MEIICVCTGTKYDDWYVNNLKHMIDKYSGLDYTFFHIMKEDRYEGVFNKLLLFEKFKEDKNYLYFDLDVIIRSDCNRFIYDDLHVCHAWWREAYHTPLNSSIMSWKGDFSHIHDKFAEDPEYYFVKYWKGIDQYLYENFQPKRFYWGFNSFQTEDWDNTYHAVTLFNQRYEYIKQEGWWNKYTI